MSMERKKKGQYPKNRYYRASLLFIILLLLPGILIAASCATEELFVLPDQPSPVEQIPPDERNVYDWILLGARHEVEKGTLYDASYQAMSYPEGDVNSGRGACTDVIIRALRHAEHDLQALIHEDMKENFHLYPQLWGLSVPDPNIDHRRTQNQIVFLERFGEVLTLEVTGETLSDWRHGDLVYWRFPDGQQHTGVISDRTNRRGIPLVIHNASVAREQDCLLRWEIIGHYRYPRENGD